MISPNIPNILREIVQKTDILLLPPPSWGGATELFHKKRAWLHANFELFILGLLSS